MRILFTLLLHFFVMGFDSLICGVDGISSGRWR